VSEVTGEDGAGKGRSDWYVEYDFVVPQWALAVLPFAALLVVRKLAMGVFGRGGVWGGPG